MKMAQKDRERKTKGNGRQPSIQAKGSLVVFSMDVVALYLSITRVMAKTAVRKAIEIAEMEWKAVKVKHLTRYVAMTISHEEIVNDGIRDIAPIPKGW